MPGLMPTNSTRTPGLMRSRSDGNTGSGGSNSGTNDLYFSMRYAPSMRAVLIVMIVLIASAPARAQSSIAEREAVLKTMQMFFDTMAAKDIEGARKILQPQGRFHAMRLREGKPDVRAFSNEEYFAQLQSVQAEDALERDLESGSEGQSA